MVHLLITLTEPTAKKYHSNHRLYKRTWNKSQWRHAVNPHIPTESLRFHRLSSVACIYRTCGWGARGTGFERNQDKTSWPLFLLLSPFIHPSLPSHIRTCSTLGFLKVSWESRLLRLCNVLSCCSLSAVNIYMMILMYMYNITGKRRKCLHLHQVLVPVKGRSTRNLQKNGEAKSGIQKILW